MYLIRPICLLDTRTILREAFLFNPRLSVRAIFRFVGMCKLRRRGRRSLRYRIRLKYYLLHGRHYTCIDIMFVESHKCKSKEWNIQHDENTLSYIFRSTSQFFHFSVIRSDDATQKNDNSDNCAPQYHRAPQRVGHTFSLDCSPTSPTKMAEIM